MPLLLFQPVSGLSLTMVKSMLTTTSADDNLPEPGRFVSFRGIHTTCLTSCQRSTSDMQLKHKSGGRHIL